MAAAVLVLTLLGFGLRVAVSQQDLFADELSTYWIVATHDLGGVISTVNSDAEITPPLSFVVAWLSTQVHLSPEWLRAPSVLAGTLTIPLVFWVGARTVGRGAGLLAAALTTLAPFMVYYSAEARGYAVMIALVTLSTLAMLLAVDGRRWAWALYAAASAAAVYTHYTSVFVLAAQALWVLWAHPEARRPALIANAAAAAAYLPWVGDFATTSTRPPPRSCRRSSPSTSIRCGSASSTGPWDTRTGTLSGSASYPAYRHWCCSPWRCCSWFGGLVTAAALAV